MHTPKETGELLRHLDNTDTLFATAEYFVIPTTSLLVQLLIDIYQDKIDVSSPFWDDICEYADRNTITILTELLALNPVAYNNLATLRALVKLTHDHEERYAYATAKSLDTKRQTREVQTINTLAKQPLTPEQSVPTIKNKKFNSTSLKKIDLAHKLQDYELAKAEIYSLIRKICKEANQDLYHSVAETFFARHEAEFTFWFCATKIENPSLPQTDYPQWAPNLIKNLFKEVKDARTTKVLPPIVVADTEAQVKN